MSLINEREYQKIPRIFDELKEIYNQTNFSFLSLICFQRKKFSEFFEFVLNHIKFGENNIIKNNIPKIME